MQESALFVEVEAAERLVGHWRRRYDPVAGRGVPAHITALFPFREPSTLGPLQLDALARLAGGIERHEFGIKFHRVGIHRGEERGMLMQFQIGLIQGDLRGIARLGHGELVFFQLAPIFASQTLVFP